MLYIVIFVNNSHKIMSQCNRNVPYLRSVEMSPYIHPSAIEMSPLRRINKEEKWQTDNPRGMKDSGVR